MNISAGAKTDTGQRPNNEDRFAVVDTRKRQIRADGVLIVADGMGGRSFGEQAASAAVETAEDALAELLDNRQVGDVEVADALATALRRANARVYALASEGEDRKGMGTTCVAAVVEGERLYVAHAGDSRAYLLRDGVLRQITNDHSYVAEQVRAGAITEEGARSSRFRNIITRAIGIEPTIDAEVSKVDVQPGDMLLLCTDGLSNVVLEDDITRTLMQSSSPQAAADKLVQMAVKSGGRDNITAIVARLQAGTRTLRMHVADLVRPAVLSGTEGTSGPASNNSRASQSSRSVFWPAAAGVLLVAALGAGAWAGLLSRAVAHDGYTFRLAPPYAVPPPPPPPPPLPPDPAHVAYDAPKVFFAHPVRGDFLSVSPSDGTVSVAGMTGTVVALKPGGQVLYKYPLPVVKPPPPPPAVRPGFAPPRPAVIPIPAIVFPAPAPPLHTATDPQGNFYVSDAAHKMVIKYRPNGDPLGLVARSPLKSPQAVGAAADGTVYVVDSGRLLVLHAHPSDTPLPRIPIILPPKPVAVPFVNQPAVPRGYAAHSRRYGFRR